MNTITYMIKLDRQQPKSIEHPVIELPVMAGEPSAMRMLLQAIAPAMCSPMAPDRAVLVQGAPGIIICK